MAISVASGHAVPRNRYIASRDEFKRACVVIPSGHEKDPGWDLVTQRPTDARRQSSDPVIGVDAGYSHDGGGDYRGNVDRLGSTAPADRPRRCVALVEGV